MRGLGQAPSSAGSLGRAPLSSPGAERAPGSGQGLRPLGSLRPDTPPPSTTPAAGSPRIPTDGLGHRVPTGAGFTFNEPPSSRARGSARAMLQPSPPCRPNRRPVHPQAAIRSAHRMRGRPRWSWTGTGGRGTATRPARIGGGGLGSVHPQDHRQQVGLRAGSGGREAEHTSSAAPNTACSTTAARARPAASAWPTRPRRPGRPPGDPSRSNPARRALLGLLFALVLGFLAGRLLRAGAGRRRGDPAARRAAGAVARDWATRRPSAASTRSRSWCRTSRRLSMRNTLIIWIAASGVMMVGWYRVT